MSEYSCPIEGCDFSSDSCRGVSYHLHYHDEDLEYPTDEMYIEAIKNLADKLGEVPTFRDMTEKGEYCGTSYHKRFGTWSNAVRRAGLEPRQTPKGEDSPNWNGGNTKFYKTDSGLAWRRAVFQRDNYMCQDCGDDTGGNLNAHHIKRRADFPDLELMVWNGITLCQSCHAERHKGEPVYEMLKSKAESFK